MKKLLLVTVLFCTALLSAQTTGKFDRVILGHDPTNATDAATKNYVDLLAQGPRYLYANNSTWWRWQLARAVSSQQYGVGGGGAVFAPVDIAIVGDSITGFGPLLNVYAASQYMPVNALGYVNFYSLHGGFWGSAVTYSESGCVDNRDDTTSAQAFGPGGSRADCSGTWSISYAPSAQFRFDTFRVWYEISPTGGSFQYSVDGGAPVTVNTAGTEGLGVTSVLVATNAEASTHAVALSNVSGSVRMYGIDTRQRAQPGFVLHFIQSGGSQLSQWAAQPSFTQTMLSTINPALLAVRLGANDGGTSAIPASTFGANLASWLPTIAPPTAATLVLTNTPRGTTTGTPQTSFCTDDATTGALYEGYRKQIFGLASSLGFSVYDERRYWPGSTATYTTYTTGCQAAMTTDQIHPSNTGSSYMAYGFATAIFQQLETSTRELPLVRNSSILVANPSVFFGQAQFQGSGSFVDSQTGMAFPDVLGQGVVQFKVHNTEYCRYGFNGNVNSMLTCYPTAAIPSVIYAYRQGSTTARAFTLQVNSDATSQWDTNNADAIVSASGVERARSVTGGWRSDKFWTTTNCGTASGTCTSASSGAVTISAGGTSVTVTTTQVTSNSQIQVTRDNGIGARMGVTCNTQSSLVLGAPYVSARVAGTSFTITIDAAPTTNPLCLNFSVLN